MFDPLNLLHPHEEDAEYEKQLSLSSPMKKKARSRNNRKRRASKANTSTASTQDGNSSTTSLDNTSDNKDFNDIFDVSDIVKADAEIDDADKLSDQTKSIMTTPVSIQSDNEVNRAFF